MVKRREEDVARLLPIEGRRLVPPSQQRLYILAMEWSTRLVAATTPPGTRRSGTNETARPPPRHGCVTALVEGCSRECGARILIRTHTLTSRQESRHARQEVLQQSWFTGLPGTSAHVLYGETPTASITYNRCPTPENAPRCRHCHGATMSCHYRARGKTNHGAHAATSSLAAERYEQYVQL